jgi:hypothetical protein
MQIKHSKQNEKKNYFDFVDRKNIEVEKYKQ